MSQSELIFVRKRAWIHNPRDSGRGYVRNTSEGLSGKDTSRRPHLTNLAAKAREAIAAPSGPSGGGTYIHKWAGVEFGDPKHRRGPSRQQRVVLGELFVRAWLAAWGGFGGGGSVSERAGSRDGFEPSRFQVEQR